MESPNPLRSESLRLRELMRLVTAPTPPRVHFCELILHKYIECLESSAPRADCLELKYLIHNTACFDPTRIPPTPPSPPPSPPITE
jgi:hypothetical protein